VTDRMAIKRQEERVRLRRIKGQTVCPNGHDLTLPRALAGRQCRECHRQQARRKYQQDRKERSIRPWVRQDDAKSLPSQTGAARDRIREIDAELLQQIDLQVRADGPQNREIKARIAALRTEKDSLDAMLRKTTGEHDQ
jgi:hypothetical protein